MMKKLFLVLATASFAALNAAMPGDHPGESKSKLEWINCSPMPLGKLQPDKDPHIPALRGVVFFYTRDDGTDQLVAMLENARRSFNGKLLTALITPDNVADLEELTKRHSDVRLRMAADVERKLTPHFMQGSGMIFPAGFLLDSDGMVIWRGEAVDLPEAAENAIKGKLDVKIQKQCAPMLDRMQQTLRSGNMLLLLRQAQQVLALEPGHPAAIRMAVFAAESIRNEKLAWDLLAAQRKAAGNIPRLTFTALELVRRHATLRKNLPLLIKEFAAAETLPATRYAFTDMLLRYFPFDTDAVLGAKNILASTPLALNAAPEEMARVLTLRARLYYAFGDVAQAEAAQAEAVQLYKHSGVRAVLPEAEKMLAFFRAMLKESAAK